MSGVRRKNWVEVMRLSEWMSKLQQLVEEAKKQGRSSISSQEVALALEITPVYASQLMRTYSEKTGIKYVRGKLILTPSEGEEQ